MTTLLATYDLSEARKTILKRSLFDELPVSQTIMGGIEQIFGEAFSPHEAVRQIIAHVREQGDSALYEWTERIEGLRLETLEIPHAEVEAGLARTSSETVAVLELAASRITDFYQKQPAATWLESTEDGVLGQIILPVPRVGVYVPGGTAPLPSSLLMSAIPASVAGVPEIIVCTPAGKDGKVPDIILAAAMIAGVSRVFSIGGAQAIAAMAYGTQTIPQVDKIVGPGNLFVMLAKREVFGVTGIDGLLGPTETMIIADETANPVYVAADILAQAEHDVLAQAILVTTSKNLAEQVAVQIAQQAKQLTRSAQFRESLALRGGAVIVPDIDTAIEVANEYGPEHLQICTQNPADWLDRVQNAGAVFLGEHSFEVLGDYVAGPSHSLPTGGTARFSSGINVWDFVKVTSVIGLTPQAADRLGNAAQVLAQAESLDGHAAAVAARRNNRG